MVSSTALRGKNSAGVVSASCISRLAILLRTQTPNEDRNTKASKRKVHRGHDFRSRAANQELDEIVLRDGPVMPPQDGPQRADDIQSEADQVRHGQQVAQRLPDQESVLLLAAREEAQDRSEDDRPAMNKDSSE
jgi:hypothetical protein